MESGGRGGRQLCKFVMYSRQGLQRKKTANQKESLSGVGEEEGKGSDWAKGARERTDGESWGQGSSGEQMVDVQTSLLRAVLHFLQGDGKSLEDLRAERTPSDSGSEKISPAARTE